MKKIDIELIEKFLDQKMDLVEEQEFKQGLEVNPELKESLERIKGIRKSIELNGTLELLEEMNTWDNEFSNEKIENNKDDNPTNSIGTLNYIENNSYLNKNNSLKTLIKIAAVIIFIVITYWASHQTSPSDNAPSHSYTHFASNMSVNRSSTNSTFTKSLQRAYDLYEIREYTLAAPLLEELYETEQNQEHLFYAALAFLYSGDQQKCLELLSAIKLSKKQKDYLQEIRVNNN